MQILHRHGDRTTVTFVKGHNLDNSPIREGQLTFKGKHSMYKLIEFFRESYSHFLKLNKPKASLCHHDHRLSIDASKVEMCFGWYISTK